MTMVLIPGYGIWPLSSIKKAARGRVIGQASRDFLGNIDATNNRTGTRDPGGADGMTSTIKLPIQIGGMSLNPLLINSLRANGGVYERSADNSWSFVLDPVLRIRLALKGIKAPCSVPADKFVCFNAVPTLPLVGGFTHPETGFHCRSAAIPVEWDVGIYGEAPGVRLTGMDPLADVEEPTPLGRAQFLAKKINERIGALSGKPAKWWLYTLPVVEDDRPVVKVGVKGDYQPDAKELKALPWPEWVETGVAIYVEFVPPAGSDVKGTVAKITPEGAMEAGMGSAPVDTVWPTSSPDWRPPEGDATGDSDPAMGSTNNPYNSTCPVCGLSAAGATRCIPGSYFCANRHEWTPKEATSGLGQSSHGFPARWRMPSKYAQPPRLRDEDSGMGSAPVVAMPTGMLNWDRVSGYEGQPWVTKDWSGQGFLDGSTTEFDDTFMGDAPPTGGAAPQPAQTGNRTLVMGALAAAAGATAGWVMAPTGDPRKGAIVGGVAGGLAGLIVGRLIGGAEGTIRALSAAKAPGSPAS